MKTYSVCTKAKSGHWVTNWGQYFDLDEINWEEVKQFASEDGRLGYGYMYGHNSRNLTASRCRTILAEQFTSELKSQEV